jgi:hypothetical protein
MRGLWSPRWIARHLGAALLVLGFLALGHWQIRRASAGNTLSWAYAIEWPVFAGFVVFIWWREVRYERRGGRPPAGPRAIPDARAADDTPPEPDETAHRGPATNAPRRPVLTRRAATFDDAADPDLAAYNRYLAWLNANPGARPADYPG